MGFIIRNCRIGIVMLAAVAASSVFAENEPPFVFQTTDSISFLDSGRDLAVDADGNAYILAYVTDQTFRNGDVFVLKLDPAGIVQWRTRLAGSGLDTPGGIALDSHGGVYVVGRTLSSDFRTRNAMQPTLHGQADAFVAKLASADGSLVYSTFFGGSNDERGNDIAVNDAGEVYFVGATVSRDIPLVNPLQSELADFNGLLYDVYIAKIAADGQSVLYGTYLGGNSTDFGDGIGLDAAGNIYVTGRTESDDWPVTNAVQPSFAGGGRDLFAARISADGSTLDYSTFLGGEDLELVGDMEVDDAGNAYIAGSTRSQFYPTTPGAFQTQFAGAVNGCDVPFIGRFNCDDMFVTKLLPDGSFAFSTYLGGTQVEEARDVAVGRGGAIYASGYAASNDFPLIGSGNNLVVSKLSRDGSRLIYTVGLFSGSANQGGGVATGPGGDVYFTGATNVPADILVARLDEGPVGDLNGDRCVDLDDLSILLSAFGAEIGGDLDADADTDLADLALLLSTFGDGCGG